LLITLNPSSQCNVPHSSGSHVRLTRQIDCIFPCAAQGSATDLTKEKQHEEAGDELKPPPEDPNKFYLCDFDMECHIEWASIVYTQTLRFNRPETMDKVFKGLSVLPCARVCPCVPVCARVCPCVPVCVCVCVLCSFFPWKHTRTRV
jgi:hypothetical protein